MHCGIGGSYLIDCDVLLDRKFDFEQDASSLDKLLKIDPKLHTDYNKDGFVISYYDMYLEADVTKWVRKELVR